MSELPSHKLNRSWTLWYDSPSTYNANNWELSLKPIMDVHTVEEFFLMLKFIKPVHALRTASQYHFFQQNVKPMWEDEANKSGGKLCVNIDSTKIAEYGAVPLNENGCKSKIDSMWEDILMAIIGEYLEDENNAESQITGLVMTKRKYVNRLAIWIKDAGNELFIENLKKAVTRELGSSSNINIQFTKHGDKVEAHELQENKTWQIQISPLQMLAKQQLAQLNFSL